MEEAGATSVNLPRRRLQAPALLTVDTGAGVALAYLHLPPLLPQVFRLANGEVRAAYPGVLLTRLRLVLLQSAVREVGMARKEGG